MTCSEPRREVVRSGWFVEKGVWCFGDSIEECRSDHFTSPDAWCAWTVFNDVVFVFVVRGIRELALVSGNGGGAVRKPGSKGFDLLGESGTEG